MSVQIIVSDSRLLTFIERFSMHRNVVRPFCLLLIFVPFITFAQTNFGGLEEGFIFEEAENFIEDRARVKFDGKYGFIDNMGQVKVPIIYDECGYFSNGFVNVKKDGKWGVVNKEGTVVVPIKYEDAGTFLCERAAVKLNDKWGYVDMFGKEIIPIQFDYVEKLLGDRWTEHNFVGGYAVVTKREKDGITQGLIDKDGKFVIPFYKFFILEDYNNDLLTVLQPVIENGKQVKKFGFVNLQGETVIPFRYEMAGDFSEGFAEVEMNGKSGYINKAGKLVLPCKYDLAGGFKGGMAWVKLNGKQGYINKQGAEVIPLGEYDRFGANDIGIDGYITAMKNGKYGIISKAGKVLVPFKYDEMKNYIVDGKVCAKINGRWGVIDINDKIILPFKYEDIGYRAFTSGYTMVKLGGKCAYINRQGKLLDIDLDAKASFKIGNVLNNKLKNRNLSETEVLKIQKASFSWFNKGASKNDPQCCFAVGLFYRSGIFVEKSYSEAVRYLIKAVELQNDLGAAYKELGYIFNEGGYGIVKDDIKAFGYFKEGAKHNNTDCIYAMTICYLNGIGCRVNLQQACAYADKLYKISSADYASLYSLCYNTLAYDYANMRNYTLAISAIDEAIRVSMLPHETANYYDSKGEIYLMMGEEEKALDMWNNVMLLDKENINFYEENSELYKQLKARGRI